MTIKIINDAIQSINHEKILAEILKLYSLIIAQNYFSPDVNIHVKRTPDHGGANISYFFRIFLQYTEVNNILPLLPKQHILHYSRYFDYILVFYDHNHCNIHNILTLFNKAIHYSAR